MLAGCDPFRGVGRGEKPEEPDAYGELIGTFFVEGRNMHLRLLDITDLYQQVCYIQWAVPVSHTHFDSLPEPLKEIVKGSRSHSLRKCTGCNGKAKQYTI